MPFCHRWHYLSDNEIIDMKNDDAVVCYYQPLVSLIISFFFFFVHFKLCTQNQIQSKSTTICVSVSMWVCVIIKRIVNTILLIHYHYYHYLFIFTFNKMKKDIIPLYQLSTIQIMIGSFVMEIFNAFKNRLVLSPIDFEHLYSCILSDYCRPFY